MATVGGDATFPVSGGGGTIRPERGALFRVFALVLSSCEAMLCTQITANCAAIRRWGLKIPGRQAMEEKKPSPAARLPATRWLSVRDERTFFPDWSSVIQSGLCLVYQRLVQIRPRSGQKATVSAAK